MDRTAGVIMKYVSPKYEALLLVVNDVITASGDKYEIESNDGNGKITFNAANIFRK